MALTAVGIVIKLADDYGQDKKDRTPGRHEDTGEFDTVKHDGGEGYGDFRTAVLPVQGDVLSDTGTVIVKHAPKELPPAPRPVLAPRTDTVMMEAVDPAKYPDWFKDELESLQ